MSERDAKLALLIARALGTAAAALSWCAAGCGLADGSFEAAQSLCPVSVLMLVVATLALNWEVPA